MWKQLVDFVTGNDALGGAVITAFGLFLAGVAREGFLWVREVLKWRRESRTEIERELRANELAESKRITDIYRNSIHYLSILSARNENGDNKIDPLEDVRREAIQCVQESLSQLSLYLMKYGDSVGANQFESGYERFSTDPFDSRGAEWLLGVVKRLAKKEGVFDTLHEVGLQEESFRLRITLDVGFRRRHYITNGILLKGFYDLPYSPVQLTEGQREKIWDIYTNNIPQPLELMLPVIRGKKLVARGNIWNANVNPEVDSLEVVFSAWEKDVDVTLHSLKQALESI